MKVSRDNVIRGVKEYIAREIAPRLGGFNAFALYFVLPSLDNRIGTYFDKFSQNDMFSEFFSGDFVELDMVRSRAKEAMKKTGGKLHTNFCNTDICLTESDVDMLYSLMGGFANDTHIK